MISQKIRELDETDKELLRMKLERPAVSYLEMAESVGLSVNQVGKRVCHPSFKRALYEYQKHAIDIIKDAKDRAARKLVALLESEHHPTVLRACVAILADVLPEPRLRLSGDVKLHDAKSELKERIAKLLNGQAESIAERN